VISPPAPDVAPKPRRTWVGRIGAVEESGRVQSVVMAIARVVSSLLAMGIPIVLVRVLSQSTFGNYKQIFLFADTAQNILLLGIPGSLYYFVPRSSQQSQRFMVQSAVLLGILGLVGGAALWGLGPVLESVFHLSMTRYSLLLSLLVALSIPAAMLSVAPMADRRPHIASVMLIGSDLFRGLLLVSVALLTRSLAAVVLATAAVYATQIVALVGYLTRRGEVGTWWPTRESILTQMRYVLPFSGAAILGLARDQLHAYYVAASFSSAEFAVYAVATLQVPFVGHLIQTIGEVLVIGSSRHFANGDVKAMRHLWYRATYVLALGLVPVFTIVSVFARDLIVVMYGPAYAPAAPVFRVFLFGLLTTIILTSPLLRATGDLRRMVEADVASLLATIAVLVLTVRSLGVVGAALSMVVGNIVFVLFTAARARERLQVGLVRLVEWRRIALVLATSAVASVLPYALLSAAPTPVRLVLGGGSAGLFYVALVWYFGLLPEQEERLLQGWIARARAALGGRRVSTEV
jgi:O-antigen/teichoic acid export membrane protein